MEAVEALGLFFYSLPAGWHVGNTWAFLEAYDSSGSLIYATAAPESPYLSPGHFLPREQMESTFIESEYPPAPLLSDI